MKFFLFQPTTQTPNLWRSLFTLILCFVLPAASSADGTKIAFESKRDGNWEIYVMDADGKNLVNLTQNGAKDLGAAWSPEGTKIAFWSTRDGNDEIYVMDADGNNPVRLTNNPADDDRPDWCCPAPFAVSPKGKLATTWGRIKGNF